MEKTIIYSKTAKGITEIKNGGRSLSRDAAKVLSLVDGKSTVAEIFPKLADMAPLKSLAALNELERLGLIKIFVGLAPASGLATAAGVDAAGHRNLANDLPMLEPIELVGEESVQAWAEAKRGASALQEKGFYSYTSKPDIAAAATASPVSVLVVEDDEAIAQLLEMLLTNRGFKVRIAVDIPSAMDALKNVPAPDLVLLDVVLPGAPGQDGFSILRHIRQTSALSQLPVIMVTSQASDQQVMQGLKDGADGYIFKPFKWDALYRCIKDVVGL